MRKTFFKAFLIVLACLTAASADTFPFDVLNSTFTGTNSPLPAGLVTVTQLNASSVSFSITMNEFAANAPGNGTGKEIQYTIGVGGFEFNLANTSNLSISSASATNVNNGSIGNITLSTGSHNYDGFGALDVNVATTNNGNNANNSAVTFNFTLTRSTGTLAISDFQALTSSNCGKDSNSIVSTQCIFVAHVNEYDVLTGGNIRTGFGGTTGEVIATPEPGSIALLGSGLLGLAGFARKRFRK
jgi:hypothetical protein